MVPKSMSLHYAGCNGENVAVTMWGLKYCSLYLMVAGTMSQIFYGYGADVFVHLPLTNCVYGTRQVKFSAELLSPLPV